MEPLRVRSRPGTRAASASTFRTSGTETNKTFLFDQVLSRFLPDSTVLTSPVKKSHCPDGPLAQADD